MCGDDVCEVLYYHSDARRQEDRMNPHVLMEGRTVLHVLIVDVVLKGRRYVHWAKVACVRVGGGESILLGGVAEVR